MELRGTSPVRPVVAQRYAYNGKELVEGIGLYDYGARWYDPVVGRWTSSDNLAALAPSWTPYRYGFNNPIAYVDPDGNYEEKAQARRARRRAIKAGYSVGKIYESGDKFGFSLGNGSHAFTSGFYLRSKWPGFKSMLRSTFSSSGERGGVELHTGGTGSGIAQDPEGTSSVIIDELVLPFGGNFGTAGKGFWKGLANALDQSTNMMSVAPGVGRMIDGNGQDLEPFKVPGAFGEASHVGPDTLHEIPSGYGGGHQSKLRRIIFNKGEVMDTINSLRDERRENRQNK
jgi:RHS repeat-associated protein